MPNFKPLLLVVLAAGCGLRKDQTNVDSAEMAIDSSDSVESEGNLMMATVDGADMVALAASTPDQVAARIAANMATRWQPAGCATVTQSDANVTVVFNDCTGPRGLLHVTGKLDLVVSVALDGTISVHGTATDLQVNLATISVDANAVYTVSGTSHAVAVETTGTGTGPRGNEIDHEGSYTVSWDTATTCRTIAGHWQTEITSTTSSATRSNDVDVERCVGMCPTGTITHHFLSGASLTVTFDGTSTATWMTSTGKSGSVTLHCP
jgi:hypothetical protein